MDVDAQHRPLVVAVEVACVPVLADNYVWLLHEEAAGETVVVDPGDGAPVLAAAAARGWQIGQVWVTHWHADHTGGIAAVKAATGATVTGPAAEATRIPALDRQVTEGDTVRIGAHEGAVMSVPGHTAGHIAFHLAEAGLLFPGDTLFAMGCGRLFEGTAAQMWANMARFAALPPETLAYGAHEYTLANARFALSVEPDHAAIRRRLAVVERQRAAGQPTLPTTIAAERATNPFVRAGSAAELQRRRAAKDAFAG